MKLFENEAIDDLQLKGLKIIQKCDHFKFGIDAVLLSDFSKIKPNSFVLDIGTGTGIIPILLSAKTHGCKFIGLEVQQQMAEMAMRSVQMNRLENISIVNGDICEWKNYFEKAQFDAIVSNPPYMAAQCGLTNDKTSITISRHEILCSLEDIISAAAQMLKPNGDLYLVHRPNRMADIFELMRKYRLEPKTLRMVYSNANSKPTLILVRANKFGKKELVVEKPLIIYKANAEYTDEIKKIYGLETSI